ncbi:M48 family metallopeptidase [Nesterenkonia sp. MY13]|uniref:M48 family metallopeptidase n=1 Tax=Nesterenkonia sedimenti TaxID=1463632 RepID=A0A7X8TIA7_9MICC|nr:M48 family metallopeptidase [Nesterenkonia sedimenti]NLS09273.1 M48 family metallopeptidase [Nesterenkonia sedimenti]
MSRQGIVEYPMTVDGQEVRVIRSAKRRRTVSAALNGGVLQLRVPMRTSRVEVEDHAREFMKRFAARQPQAAKSDEALHSRAEELIAKYFPDLPISPRSVTWSTRQQKRWGSTTTTEGTIRLSARLRGMPEWVVDAVLIHELAHLVESGHGPRFQELVNRYPRTQEADGFLAGVQWAST